MVKGSFSCASSAILYMGIVTCALANIDRLLQALGDQG